jgi:hypothetical protein
MFNELRDLNDILFKDLIRVIVVYVGKDIIFTIPRVIRVKQRKQKYLTKHFVNIGNYR